jgi:mRNA-degrading endonuclease RelE of RelBE toxin-antitoxin system
VTFELYWEPPSSDQLRALFTSDLQIGTIIAAAISDLGDNPSPTNSVALGTSQVRRLLLGYYSVTHEVQKEQSKVVILTIGRSNTAR